MRQVAPLFTEPKNRHDALMPITRTLTASEAVSLESTLAYTPQVLKFGTSGRRGEVIHLTQLEIYINALAEIEYLQSLSPSEGGIKRGEEFYFAADLRPSSTRFVAEQGGRGEIAQAIQTAVGDGGMKPVNLGLLPTPALTFYALRRQRGSMMVTGSHIPFDRNGYKTNSAKGELLKKDEPPIAAKVEEVRARIYAQSATDSKFDRQGGLKVGSRALPPALADARENYIRRYTDFFPENGLAGKRLVIYQHSAVGRDLLPELLKRFGAEVIQVGRSETFVPIDTEAIDDGTLTALQLMTDAAIKHHGKVDAVVSTDGDSDRPLVLGVDSKNRVKFYGGDLVGMVVAEYLQADGVVVPISCNDAIDRGGLSEMVEPKTRIGSPFVITGMAEAQKKGRRAVVGWEANGGFLTGSDITRDGKTLHALPTRDAILPILGTLFGAFGKGIGVTELFDSLPRRFSRAALLRRFPRAVSMQIVKRFSPASSRVADIHFEATSLRALDIGGKFVPDVDPNSLWQIRRELEKFFTPEMGFGRIARLNYTDGVRVYFDSGDVAHVRPSGNADELRIYAVADTQARADAITAGGVAEPDGILRRLERYIREGRAEMDVAGRV
jgi:phosphomannomutase